MMKRKLSFLVYICLITAAVFASPWKGGYEIGVAGYSHPSMSESNTLSSRLTWILGQGDTSMVRLSAGGSFSNPLFSPVDQYADAAVSCSLRLSDSTPLKEFLMRDAFWYASIEAGVFVPPFDADEAKVYLSISPFVLYFGEKLVSVASPAVVYDFSTQKIGWGLTLVRITQLMW